MMRPATTDADQLSDPLPVIDPMPAVSSGRGAVVAGATPLGPAVRETP
jgi:hypothetical protein